MATIRMLGPADAAAYQALRLRGLRESPTAFSSSYEEEAERSVAEVVARVTPAADGSKCVFGAFVDGALGGVAGFMRPMRPKLLHTSELVGMYVAPEQRRLHFGRALVEAVVAHARAQSGVEQIKLGVNAANEPAKGLYRACGFGRYGVEPNAIRVDGVYYDEELYVLRF
ncbi:MAG TPA: GNAT family N-acetyltransferase [Pseudomonadales bacterium]|nr:GNAT family N-acetyltransferase [Pseudomonadales bacterium]